MNVDRDFLWADWPAPASIRAGTTGRTGGVSLPPYDSLNLATHTGDDPAAVARNRQVLREALSLPGEPVWLEQVHGRTVVSADTSINEAADAAIARRSHTVCAILTADCLPVVFCDRAGAVWGAAHAGWRGLAAGVLEATVRRMDASADNLMAWLGPAIGADNFVVGRDVREAFCQSDPDTAAMFKPLLKCDKYAADIYALARHRLARIGLTEVYGGGFCTIDNVMRYYSYRRHSPTGRMATLIWSVAGSVDYRHEEGESRRFI